MHKILLLGSEAIGKTAWLDKIIDGKYDEKYTPTLYNNLREINYKNIICIDATVNIDNILNIADGIFIMCNFNAEDVEYVKNIKLKLNIKNINIPTILVINKLDLDVEQEYDFEKLTNELNIDTYIAISVKDEYNLYEPFDKMMELLNKPTLDTDILLIFIRELLLILKKSDNNIQSFKIEYLLLLYNDKYYKNENLSTLNQDLTSLILASNNTEPIIMYLINNLK